MDNILDMVLKGESAIVSTKWSTTPDGGISRKEAKKRGMNPEDADTVDIKGKISFEGLTVRQVMEIATKPIIIKRQVIERTMVEIPTSVTIHANSAGQKPQDVNTVVSNMSKEDAKKALAQIKAKFGDLV